MLVRELDTQARAPAVSRACLLVMLGGVVAVVAVVPLLVDPTNPANIYYAPKARALYVLAPLLALAWLGRACLLPSSIDRAILVPTLAFAVVATAATWASVNPARSLWGAPWRNEGLLTLLAYVAIFLASASLRQPPLTRWWLAATLAGASLVALYGIAQYAGYEWIRRDWQRVGWWQAFSTTGNPNWLGAYMALALPLALAAIATAWGAGGLVASTVALGLIHLTALLTYGRAAWLAVALVVGVTGALVFWQRRALPVHRYLWGLLLALVTGIFFVPGSPLTRGPEGPAPLPRAQSIVEWRDTSIELRFYLWRETAALLRRRPLLGYGPETLPLVFPQRDQGKVRILGTSLIVDKAHNETLDMAMSVGILGVGTFWWLVLVSLRRAWRAAQTRDTPALGIACLAGILGYLFDLQFHFSVVSVAPVFWSVLGVAAGLGATGRSEAGG